MDHPNALAAGGDITVLAQDAAGIDAVSNLLSASSTSNDGGVSLINDLATTLLDEYDYTTSSGVRDVVFGDRVRVSDSYGNGGEGGEVYQYMGTDQSGAGLDLGLEDYADFGFWKKLTPSNILPTGLNVSGSDSIGIGGQVVLNDVRGAVEAFIDDFDVATSNGDIEVSALEQASLRSLVEGIASSSGGSAYGTGTSLAVNGTIATNLVLSSAEAYVTGSTVAAADAGDDEGLGNISVTASNSSTLDATLLSSTSSGDTAVGVSLAFNTIGWAPQNLLFNTIDALVGSSIGTEDPASVRAYVEDTDVTASGDLTVSATSAAQLNAAASNVAVSEASALFNATGASASAILVSNMVSSDAEAYLRFTGAPGTVDVGGSLSISAEDSAGVAAETIVDSSSTTTNDGGAAVLSDALSTLLDDYYDYTTRSGTVQVGPPNYDHTTADGTVSIVADDQVKVAYGYTDDVEAARDHDTEDGDTALVTGDIVEVLAGYTAQDHDTDDTAADLKTGDVVLVASGAGEGDRYRYLGSDTDGVDLSTTVFTAPDWAKIAGETGGFYKYLDADLTRDLGAQDYTDETLWRQVTGDEGMVYKAVSGLGSVDLATENFNDDSRWTRLGASFSDKVRIGPGYDTEDHTTDETTAVAVGEVVEVVGDIRRRTPSDELPLC